MAFLNVSFAILIFVFCIDLAVATKKGDLVKALLHKYDATLSPNFEKNNYTMVDVGLFINSIDSISEQTMDFTMSTYVQQEWRDGRLRFLSLIESEYLELDTKITERIWVPDLYFSNEKKASFHDITVPNRMIHLYKDGTIKYRTRITLTASCPMALHKYPLDQQVCSLFIQSFAYSTNRLRFRWKEPDPVRLNPHLQLPQFNLTRIETEDCTGHDGEGNFTCIRFDMILTRNIGFYMIQIYVPSFLVVMLSWVSFYLSVDAVPARVSLGIITVLTITTQRSMAVQSLPRVSYVKAIDVWMAVCLGFVFAALLEYAFVNLMSRQIRPAKVLDGGDAEKTVNDIGAVRYSFWSKFRKNNGNYRAKKVDYISRIVFPVVFILFTLFYWILYIFA